MKQKTFILLAFLLCFICIANAQGPTKPKLCSTCGKMVVNCPYKGNHPKCATCGKLKESCPYKGNHPKCATCGKVKEGCAYNGNHPKCDVCGKVKESCPYNGSHPKCATCGKLKDACTYKGNHSKCSICAKYIGASSNACAYDGNHPVEEVVEEDIIFEVVEKMPHFPGDNGDGQVMMAWFIKNIKYPSSAQDNNIQGTAYVQFVVGKDGSINNPTIAKSSGDRALDDEAVRVVKCMPKWVPGNQQGKPVSVKYTLPVRFRTQPVRQNNTIVRETITVNGVPFNMIKVEGGFFWMGAQKTNILGENFDSNAYDWESPVHHETISTFYMGETEVTQELWQAVMGNLPSRIASSSYDIHGSKRPVCYVSWNDCQTFIKKLNSQTNRKFRLPTEAEWEYAARGGNKSNHYKYSGSNSINQVAWYTSNTHDKGSHYVKRKSPNELGLYDMSGNVYEWTNSYWRSNYHVSEDRSRRVSRCGSWYGGAGVSRVSFRNHHDPDFSDIGLGFRLALDPQ